MFKFIATLIALFTALNSYTAVPAKDAPSKEEQKRIYEELLTGIASNNDWGDYDTSAPGPGWFSQPDSGKWRYAYFDMNGDGIDELLIGEEVGGLIYGNKSVKSPKTVLQFIVTICNGRAAPIKDFMGYFPDEDYYAPVLYSNGTVVEDEIPANTSEEFYRHLRLENGELKTTVYIRSDTGTRGIWGFSVNNNGETTECKIPGFIAKIIIGYLNKGEVVEPDWQPLAKFAQP